MDDFSILIGGKAGFGIDKAGLIIARIFNQLGYRIYVYREYPSLIRGGHTFSIIRASKDKIATHQNKVDFLLALNQDTLNLHKNRLRKECFFIYDCEQVKINVDSTCGVALAIGKILKEENAPEVMRNTCIIGALCKATGIGVKILEDVLKKEISKEIDLNLKVARRGFDEAKELIRLEPLNQKGLPLLSGNQAMGLGLIKGGLKTYIAYPMTPSSPILHFLADMARDFNLKVIHPESEIGVILMALGFSYMGEKVAIGTSGGGFCLMTEGLSFAGMSELPVVIVLGQRPGPSTGLPTYSAQTDLHFALNAGQGEFPRFIVAPGDPEEAYFWSALAMNIAWKYQIPAIILSDKNLGEGLFNFDIDIIPQIEEERPVLWDKKSPYKRYLNTENGVSPLAFVPDKDAIVKVNSYEHDEFGITSEEIAVTNLMQDKRLRKEKYLLKELESCQTVKVYGNKDSQVTLLCWGSNKGVCVEVAQNLGLKVIQPLVLSPFPVKEFQKALTGVKKIINVENNATGQLIKLIKGFGFNVDENILKYDGRPFSLDELEEAVRNKIGG
ncbi:MAG: 2-oxoacid:acceptor oxidoreductase subunit alpha [Candidatus Omnitrophota bacterium]|nr:2-oxoacid:acceptor oxidoreductase subunit alpha [Candidatus Omnitrophota bacterium]